MSPATLTLRAGQAGTSTINITRTGGFAIAVTLAASGAPAGVTVTIDPSPTTAGSAMLRVVADAVTALGATTVTVTGTASGMATQTASVALQIDAPVVARIVAGVRAPQLEVGDTTSATAVLSDSAGGAIPNGTVQWRSGAPEVATVNAAGRVQAIGAGTAELVASVGDVVGRVSVHVLAPIARLTLGAVDTARVLASDSVTLSVTALDTHGVRRPVGALRLTVDDGTVATVVRGSPAPAFDSAATLVIRGRSRGRATLTAEALSVGGQVLAGQSVAVQTLAPRTATLTVDFAQRTPVALQYGFLLGIARGGWVDTTDNIPDSLITLLRPRYWRQRNLRMKTRMDGLGARMDITTSQFTFLDRLQNVWPYDDWALYERRVRDSVRVRPSTDIVWEPWNEPDYPGFWKGTEAQSMETYARTYRVLRAELGPTAVIAGPSLGTYNLAALVRWADYCLSNGCEINALTWHYLGFEGPADGLLSQVTEARHAVVDNPKYAPLNIREIHINEYLSYGYMYAPGAVLTQLHYLERTGVHVGARACWNEIASADNGCESNGLDNLLDPTGQRPRASWWAHRAYADGVDTRVSSTTTDPRFVALASAASRSIGTPQVLVSMLYPGDAAAWYGLQLVLNNVPSTSGGAAPDSVRVSVTRVPSETKDAWVGRLTTSYETTVAVRDGRAIIPLEMEKRRWERLPGLLLAPYDVLIVQVLPAPGGR